MHEYLLDTNTVSYWLKQTSTPLLDRLTITQRDSVAVSCVTEAELRYGAAIAPADARIRRLISRFLPTIACLPWTSACAESYAELGAQLKDAGKPLSVLDMMIGAHALALNLTLVTSDKAFRHVPGLQVQDWTQAQ